MHPLPCPHGPRRRCPEGRRGRCERRGRPVRDRMTSSGSQGHLSSFTGCGRQYDSGCGALSPARTAAGAPRFVRRTLPVAPIAHVALEYNRGSGSCSCPAASRLRQCMKYPCDAALPPLRTRPGRQPHEPRRYSPATAIPLPGYAARLAQGSPRPRDLVCRHYSPGSPPDAFVCGNNCFRPSADANKGPVPRSARPPHPPARQRAVRRCPCPFPRWLRGCRDRQRHACALRLGWLR